MIFNKYTPTSPLNQYVESICYIEGNNQGTGLPKIAMSLVFNLQDDFKLFSDKSFSQYTDYKRYWVAGLQTKPTYVASYGSSKMFVVQFKTIGASLFLNDSLHYFTNNYVNLDCIYNKEAEQTWEQLHIAKNRMQQFLCIENFLISKLAKHKLPNKKLEATVQLLLSNSSSISINQICNYVNLSRKHLNFLSKEFAGVSTKTIFSLIRLQQTLSAISSSPKEKLTNIAYDFDYFDQAHFISDFKRFTSITPREYAQLAEKTPSLQVVPHFIPFF